MLTELERRLVAAGVHRITCLLADEGEMGAVALEHCGYTARRGVSLYQKLEPVGPADVGILGQLGGRMIRAGSWEQLGGMAREKELIERRVILPLANSQLAGWRLSRRRRSSCSGPRGRERPPSPRVWPPGWAGRLWNYSPPGSPETHRPAWPPRCGRRSRWWP